MKIKTTLALLALALPLLAHSGERPAPRCCAVSGSTTSENPRTEKSCCAEEKASVPLTARSLYQLDAKWANDEGAVVELASLQGRPVVLALFFASCEYACPLIVDD